LISDDGQLTDLEGNTIGFINNDGSAGDASSNFVGEINDDGQISNGDNVLIGSCDMGTAEMRSENGSHFSTIKPGGDIYDGLEGFRGRVVPFTFHKLRLIAAYIFFFDQNLIDPKRGTKLPIPDAPKSTDPSPRNPLSPKAPVTPKTPVSAKVPESEPTINLPPPQRQPVESTKPAVTEDREYKEYKVGEFKTISDGKENLLEITNCDCPLSQLNVRIEKQGKQVVFQRNIHTNGQIKQQVQRFTLPYVVTKDRISAKYSIHTDYGTLTLSFKKPEGASATGGTSGQFIKFVVPAVPNSEDKVTVKASQEKDHFLFDVTGDPKLETEVIGELDGGCIKFHAITKDLEAGVSKKSSQSFSLGNVPVSLSQIDVEGGGKKVFVYPKRPIQVSPANPSDPIPDDTDIPIQSI